MVPFWAFGEIAGGAAAGAAVAGAAAVKVPNVRSGAARILNVRMVSLVMYEDR